MNVNCYFIVYFSVQLLYLHFQVFMCNFVVLCSICLLTFSHDAVQIVASPESLAGGVPNCQMGNWVLSLWARLSSHLVPPHWGKYIVVGITTNNLLERFTLYEGRDNKILNSIQNLMKSVDNKITPEREVQLAPVNFEPSYIFIFFLPITYTTHSKLSKIWSSWVQLLENLTFFPALSALNNYK